MSPRRFERVTRDSVRPRYALVSSTTRGVIAVPILPSSRGPLRWRRSVPEAVLASLRRWSAMDARDVDTFVDVREDDFAAVIPELDDPWATLWLRADVESLARTLASLAGSSKLRLVFAFVDGDRCRKFHVDYVRLRLVTTYLGPGTEWIDDVDVDRAVLAESPRDIDEANRRVVRPGGSIRRADDGEILVLRGARGGDGPGTVHRSPPIAALGIDRVFLSLTAGGRTDFDPTSA